jgi:thioredoxin reductase (NADPH)
MQLPEVDLVIIGGGPAGLASAIYGSRARMKTIVIERMGLGGQINLTDEVENYPGILSISGPELVMQLEQQAKSFGAEFKLADVTKLDFEDGFPVIHTEKGTIKAYVAIAATGADPKRLNVPGEFELGGRGVSYCATCDGAFYVDRKVVVVGGGDAAVEEGIFLTRYASEVNIIHRRHELRASQIVQERAFANPKVHFIWDSVVDTINGDDFVESVSIKNLKSNKVSDLATDGVFIFIGHTPNSSFYPPDIPRDIIGCLVVDINMRTKYNNLYAVGDLRAGCVKQLASSMGDGVTAAINATRYIEERKFELGVRD